MVYVLDVIFSAWAPTGYWPGKAHTHLSHDVEALLAGLTVLGVPKLLHQVGRDGVPTLENIMFNCEDCFNNNTFLKLHHQVMQSPQMDENTLLFKFTIVSIRD